MRETPVVALLFVLAIVAAEGTQPREHDATWTAPPSAAAKPNPLDATPAVVAGGRKLFEERCASCHGPTARGTNKAPDLTHPDVQHQSDGALFWKISSGNTRKGMPGFSFLPTPQRWQLVLELRAEAHDTP